MKKYTKFGLLGILVVIMFVTAAIILFYKPKERTINDPNAVFNEMLLAESTDNCTYSLKETEIVSVGEETYIFTTRSTINGKDCHSDHPSYFVEKICTIGDHAFTVTELYKNNTLYIDINNASFYADVSPEEITQRYIPKIIITPELYTSISGVETKDAYQLHFVDASAPENWLSAKDISFEKGEGYIIINRDKTPQKLIYYANYRKENSYVQIIVEVEPIAPTQDTPEIINNACIPLQSPDAPEILERACGYILASQTINAKYKDSILCEAFGDLQTQQINIAVNESSTQRAEIETTILLENKGKAGTQNHITKKETFTNGKYSISINGNSVQEPGNISESDMRTLYRNILISTVMLPENISQCNISLDEDHLTLHFSTNNAFTELIIEDACAKLYGNPDILKTQSEEYTTAQSTCYLTIDSKTGIPISSGFFYSGIYTINAIPYKLEYSADQEYTLISR